MTSVSHASSSTAGADPLSARQTPWSEEAEQAVLGAMLLDPDAGLKAVELLDDTAFHRDAHRRVFRTMAKIVERGDVVDPVVLRDELARTGDLEAAGGTDYIAELLDVVPTAANVEYHCRIVKDKALRRRLIEAGTDIVQAAYEGPLEVDTLLDEAEHRIFEVSFQRGTREVVRIKELMWRTMERIEARHRGDESVQGVPSGYADLDEKTNGFQGSDLIIVAARPAMGKTAFCLNVAVNAALEGNVPTAIFSLEMSRDQLLERLLAAESFVDLSRLRSGKLRDDDYPKMSRAAGLLGTAPIWVDDTPALTLLELRSKARRLKAEHHIGLMIVDYLQLLRGPTRAESRQEEISFISRSLKALARELATPLIALSQLSRAPEQRGGDRRPMLSDLRDSGAIEQDADLVMFIYRPEMYPSLIERDGAAREGMAELILAKHRNGPTGTIKLAFHKQYTRFESYADREPEGLDGP
ncbi:MAG: replicative DNA helicase [Gemmatimonadales bacterium]|nr:replicative DNA helicase [Gemmatimonadales bacterium]NIN50141.1 replicative DNA helicase [Gemmatimonadales bacterium]NIP07605.1 replicative DNA helicase [Gemmatimonadales bacterium]NIR01757.1 replicative DNA helicase [Gemmatimonadales bacterium]NIS65660.1 replicative DNA helicase [Gemmatimonadales bacterium]